MTTHLNTMDWWTAYFTSILNAQHNADDPPDPEATIKLIGDSIKQTFGPARERPQGHALPIAEHIDRAQMETRAAERTLTTATCGPWALPYRSVLIYCVMHDVDESAALTAELEDRMAADIIRECGLEEYCDGLIGLGQFVTELAKVWSDTLEHGMEDAPPADPVAELGDTTVRH